MTCQAIGTKPSATPRGKDISYSVAAFSARSRNRAAQNRRTGMADILPISIKGVLIEDSKVVLLENERGEWELPGGRPEKGEQPSICLIREFAEELGTEIEVGPIIDCWNFEVLPSRYVMIVTYAVTRAQKGKLRISDEHQRFGWFPL